MTRILFLVCFFAFAVIKVKAEDFEERRLFCETHLNDEPASIKSGIIDPRRRWQNGTIPYIVDYTFPYTRDFYAAIRHITGRTCIRFNDTIHARSHIYVISNGSLCYSFIGRIGGRQIVSLGAGCGTFLRNHIHELVHVIGFFHEHERTDRDQFVTINEENILGHNESFQKYDSSVISPFGVPYDYNSVLHYGRKLASRDLISDTITPMDPDATIGEKAALSNFDIKKINNMYCPGTMGIRIQNVESGMYLQVNRYQDPFREVVTANWTGAENQNWTLDWYAARDSTKGSPLIPWSQDEHLFVQSAVDLYGELVVKRDWENPVKWVFTRTSYRLDSVWQIGNKRFRERCLGSVGTPQPRTIPCDNTDPKQLWNVYTA